MAALKFTFKICQTDNDLVELVKHEEKKIEEEETKQQKNAIFDLDEMIVNMQENRQKRKKKVKALIRNFFDFDHETEPSARGSEVQLLNKKIEKPKEERTQARSVIIDIEEVKAKEEEDKE